MLWAMLTTICNAKFPFQMLASQEFSAVPSLVIASLHERPPSITLFLKRCHRLRCGLCCCCVAWFRCKLRQKRKKTTC